MTTDADGVLTADALADAPPASLGGGQVESWATNVRTTEDGYVVVGGAQRSGTTDSARTLLVEYDDRFEVTATVVPGIFGEYGIDVVVVDDGYVVLSQRTSQLIGGDAVLRKVTPEGGVVWERVYGGQGDQTVQRLAATPDGGFVTAGSTDDDRDGEDDAWLVKFDGEGTIDWERTYERTPGNDDTARTVAPTSDGGYVLAGQTTVVRSNAASADGWLVKTDASGAMEWERSFGGAGSEGFNDVVEVEPGVYGVAGFTRSYAPTIKGWILQVDGDADPTDDETVFVPTAIDGSDEEVSPGATPGEETKDEPTDTPDDGVTDSSGPGFGVDVVVLAVLLGAAFLVSRRRFGR